MQPIVIAAGGTGGHFFPAEALAAALIKRGHRIVLMTDARSGALRSDVFAGHEIHIVRSAGIAGRGLLKAIRATASIAAGTIQARALLSRTNAAAIVAFGGYSSLPPMVASRLLWRRPLRVLHEQNAVLGRANRFLVGNVDVLATGFARTARVPFGMTPVFVGNPVRPAIQMLAGVPFSPPDVRIELLITGGSLGARIFSDVVPAAIALLPDDLRARLHVVQQCRAEDLPRVEAAYHASGVDAELSMFFHDMAQRLAAAHLIIGRAGASTCAEIAAVGRPAILVPLPGAIDNHQAANARAVTGATVIAQPEFSANTLSETLRDMLADTGKLAATALLVASGARLRAAEDLADIIEAHVARVGANA